MGSERGSLREYSFGSMRMLSSTSSRNIGLEKNISLGSSLCFTYHFSIR